ncbi:MAG: SH3 domain-containing protein [Thermodesulfobacteriota bacterium]
MSNDKKLVSSIDEQIARISNNFESDVLRLIKTQSMIKSSEEIINDEVEFLKTNIDLIGSKLDEIGIKTSEINEIIHLYSEKSNHSNAHFDRYLNEYLDLLTAHSNELKNLKSHLSERLSHGSASLQSLQKYYIAELKAFEHEVDSNLDNFKAQLKESLDTELPNNNHKNESDESSDTKEFSAYKGKEIETVDLETVDLETVEELPVNNNGSNEKESNKTVENKPVTDVHDVESKTNNTKKEKQTDYKYKTEQERLENEFKSYKESFGKKQTTKTKIRKEPKGDVDFEKMFSSSVVNKERSLSTDFRKYILGAILIVWVIAVLGFYLYFLKKDEVKNTDSVNSINQTIINEDYNNNEFMASNKVTGDNADNSTLIRPSDNNVEGSIVSSIDESDTTEKVEDILETVPGIEDEELSPKKEVATQPEYDYSVIVKKANIRKGPGKSYGIVNTLIFGKQVQILNDDKGIWVKIKSEDGDVGWIGKRLILKN